MERQLFRLTIASVVSSSGADSAMGKLLKYMTVLILVLLASFLYVMNEETFYTSRSKLDLFNSYLKRASDPHEKQLRLAETEKVVSRGVQGKLALTTLKFVDEKYYLNAFSKTYKLLITREAGIDNVDHEWINAGLYLDIDYGVRKEHEVIFFLRRVVKKDTYWNVLSSLYDKPIHSVRKKISETFPDAI
jgi:uncharacterized protein YxeA